MLRRIFCFAAIAVMLMTGIALTQEEKNFLADRHQKRGLKCSACHSEEPPKVAATQEACLKCHKSLETVAERTKDFEKNPHDNHITQATDVECTQCHHGHKDTTPVCEQCHSGMTFEKRKAEPAN